MYDFKITRNGRALFVGTLCGDYWRGAYRVQTIGGRAFTLHGFNALQHFANRNDLTIEWL